MRTQWQSGNYKMCESLMGNRFFGDDKADSRESLPDLCRKLYSVHYPIILNVIQMLKYQRHTLMPCPANMIQQIC